MKAHPRCSLLLGYFLLALVFAGELLVPGRGLYRWDTLLYNWPVLLETRAQFLSGYMPFWADSFCCGTPLLENLNAGVFYPLRLLCWFLPLEVGYQLFLFLHVWLSLLGMHVLLRRGFRMPVAACVVGALAYAAGGYARSMWDTHNFMALPWLPLATMALLEARHPGRTVRAALAAAVTWAMLLLCGDFQAAVLWVPVAALLALFLPERKRLLAALGLAVPLAMLLTAPQWVPASVVAAESYRAGGLALAEASEHSLHPLRLLELIVPCQFGTRGGWWAPALAGEGAVRTTPWTTSIHIGLLALLAAVFSLRRMRTPEVRWALTVWLAGTLLSLGRFLPVFELWHALPVVENFRYPQKYVLWSTFALAVLAARGTPVMIGLWCRRVPWASRGRILAVWTVAAAVAAGAGAVVLVSVAEADLPGHWVYWRAAPVFALLVLVWFAAVRGWRAPCARAAVVGLLMAELAVAWYTERPTTAGFQPAEMPAPARAIRQADAWGGRVLCDFDLDRAPLPRGFDALTKPEQDAVFFRSVLRYNSPRLWGLRTAAGFSPTESAAMRALRVDLVEPPEGAVDVAGTAEFIKRTAVRWWLTTPQRAEAVKAAGVSATRTAGWGGDDGAVLMKIEDAAEAVVVSGDGGPVVRQVWRARAGRIRVDLEPGTDAQLIVRETYARGWRATDAYGSALEVEPADEAFIGVRVPGGVNQVRLAYEPVRWNLGLALGGVGLAGWLALLGGGLGWARVGRWFGTRCAMVTVLGALFMVLGFASRGHWSCTFDEGFHLTRGLARATTGDSRLSYYHPPLQNLACGYFADLAWGDHIELPSSPGWRNADVYRYATEWASMNAGVFPESVRAARIGTSLFGLLLCLAGALWARRVAGPVAGWLAGAGLALSPTVLAHGNLVTSDMGVAAFVVAGTAALWRAVAGGGRGWHLVLASACFVLAAVAKFTGLIWLAAYLVLVLPALAALRRDPRVLLHALLAVVFLVGVLLCLYGPAPQTIRITGPAFLADKAVPAGRYVEGLFRQGAHALGGQRAFFAGQRFTEGSWWHLPAAAAIKTPTLWMVAALLGLGSFVGRRRSVCGLLPWLPAACFALLLFSANKLAIGVRHVLPLLALGVVGAAVWAARLKPAGLRRGVTGVLMASVVWGIVATYPNFISFTALWAGHTGKGYAYVVDSNYDWGQDVEQLEEQWAMLTDANKGQPPRLAYFGFLDPSLMYGLAVSSPSLLGHMGHMRQQNLAPETYKAWRDGLATRPGVIVGSVSDLALDPYGIDFARVRESRNLGRIGLCFFVHHLTGGDHGR